MSDNKVVSICAATVLIILIVAPTSCTMHNARQMTEMVKAGADPQEARCAIEPTPANCNAVLAKRGR